MRTKASKEAPAMSWMVPLNGNRRMLLVRTHVAGFFNAGAQARGPRDFRETSVSGVFSAKAGLFRLLDPESPDGHSNRVMLIQVALHQVLGAELANFEFKALTRTKMRWKVSCRHAGRRIPGHAVKAVVETVLRLEALSLATGLSDAPCETAAESGPAWSLDSDN